MPVILPVAVWGAWLDPSIEDPSTLRTLLGALGSPDLEEHPVSTLVNKVANNVPELIERLETGAVEG
jgi:putative SOS response-associated peptidase YedK